MKSNVIAWLGVASVVGGAVMAAACGDSTNTVQPGVGLCGNGILETNEQCDDGNTVDEDNCTAACRNAACGDGVCAESEEGECADDCESTSGDPGPTTGPGGGPKCGDGNVDEGEQCDEWAEGETKKNSASCDIDCTLPECEDGVLNLAADECCETNETEDCSENDADNGPDLGLCACPQDPSGSGGSGGGPGGCEGAVALAGYVVNKTNPTSTTPAQDNGVNGISAVWNYGGQIGIQAGNDMCAAIGADHVCEWDEVKAADAAGELAGVVPAGQAFWVHRLESDETQPNGNVTEPGPGGRCNDWTYPTGHISDGEMAIFQATGLPGSGWQVIGNLTAKFDNDTCYTGNPATCPGGDSSNNGFGGVNCGGQGAPPNSNGSVAILCCFPICVE
jgi:cysteine-rich repeat protein